MDIRDNLRQLIETKGYKQINIAQRSNLTPAILSSILNKRRKLDAEELFSVCDALNITPSELREYPCETS